MLGVGPTYTNKRLDDDATENEKPHLQLSSFLWRRHICGFTGKCHCTWLKGLKCAVVCYFHGRIFYPTNLLNHVAPFIELMIQM